MTKRIIVSVLLMAGLCGCADDKNDAAKACSEEGFVSCNGNCIHPGTSREFCGADATCQNFVACKGDEVCANGKCVSQASTCTGEKSVLCANVCINPNSDNNYCGAREGCVGGQRCGETQKCINGTCTEVPCEDRGLVTCNSVCINPLTDNQHCGAKANCMGGQDCGATMTCNGGVCQADTRPCMEPGYIRCNGTCIDPLSDKAYCGAQAGCIGFTACLSDQNCISGTCVGATGPSCTSPEFACDNRCINPQTDRDHCGATDCTNGSKCGPTQGCIGGVCTDKCEPGKVFCSGNCLDPNNRYTCGVTEACNDGARCRSNQLCEGQKCVLDPEKVDCSKAKPNEIIYCEAAQKCIDPFTDDNYCHANFTCDTDSYEKCANGKHCVKGECVIVPKCHEFKDAVMKEVILSLFDTDNDGCLVESEEDAINDEWIAMMAEDGYFQNRNFETLDDLNYFPKVTVLPDEMFEGCKKLKTVELTNIVEIGARVFADNISLKTVNLPKITILSEYAFYNCASLDSASFNSVVSIDQNPFMGCTSLKKLSLSSPGAINISYSNGLFGNDNEDPSYISRYCYLTLNKNKKSEVTSAGFFTNDKIWKEYRWEKVSYVD